MIVAKFGSNWFSGFREEDFWKSLQTDDHEAKSSDGNSSRGLLARWANKGESHVLHQKLNRYRFFLFKCFFSVDYMKDVWV
jgi:hypothetical protein